MTEIATARPAPLALRLRHLGRSVLDLPFAFAGTLALLAVAHAVRPALLSPPLLLLIARQAAPLGLAVIGQSLCMRVLSLDLSIGGVVLAVGYLLTSGILPFSEPALLIACLALGVAVGAVNAVFVTRLRSSSVIVTLAMAMILSGFVFTMGQLRGPGDAPDMLRYVGQARIGILPVALLAWLALGVPAAVFLRVSVFGRYVDAIGANPKAAWTSGLPYTTIVTLAHLSSAVFAVFSAFLLVGFIGVGSLDIGQDLPLNSLAAVILGGVSFGSGRGGILGPAAAAFMLTFSFNLLTSLGLGESSKLMVQGAVIALAAAVYAARSRTP